MVIIEMSQFSIAHNGRFCFDVYIKCSHNFSLLLLIQESHIQTFISNVGAYRYLCFCYPQPAIWTQKAQFHNKQAQASCSRASPKMGNMLTVTKM